MAQRKQVLTLYANLIKIGKRWATQPDRENRNLHDHIINQTRNLFKQNKSVSDNATIKQLLQKGNLEFQALSEISKGMFQKNVRCKLQLCINLLH